MAWLTSQTWLASITCARRKRARVSPLSFPSPSQKADQLTEDRASRSSVLSHKSLRGRNGATGTLLRVVDDAANEREPARVVLDVASDLDLEVIESLGDGLTSEPRDLLVRVSEPADGSRVRGETLLADPREALCFPGLLGPEELEGFFGGDGILLKQVSRSFLTRYCTGNSR